MRSLIVVVLLGHAAFADEHWQGTMTRSGASIPIEFELGAEAGRFTSVEQAVREYPFDAVHRDATSLHVVLGGNTKFDGTITGATIRGTFADGRAPGTFELHRTPTPVAPYHREDVRFTNGAVVLRGTLLVPSGARTAVVFMHGSGAEVRWGRALFFADVLARHGVAALVYDKRGTGESTGDWKTASYTDLGDDALAAIHFLESRGLGRVGVFGHSEGGTIGPLLAARSKDVAFLISAAGVVGTIHDGDVLRVRHNLEDHGFSKTDVEAALSFYRRWVEVGRAGGNGWERVHALVPGIEHTKWYGWVELPPRDSWVWSWYPKVADVDTTQAWPHVHVPVLVVFGERDRIEAVDPDLAVIDRALRTAGNHDVTELILPAAAHNLTVTPPDSAFDGLVAPGWPDVLATWVSAHAR